MNYIFIYFIYFIVLLFYFQELKNKPLTNNITAIVKNPAFINYI